MQIFSTLHTLFSSNREKNSHRGFTLTELLICVAIIGMVTSIVLVKYSSFDSTVLLKDTAYEIALGLREAQIKSVSVVRGDTNFNYPYGMSFSTADAVAQKTYHTFLYENADVDVTPSFDDDAATIHTTNIGRSMQVSDVCINTTGDSDDDECDIDRLDISFRRPEFASLFFVDGGGYDTSSQPAGVEYAKIKVDSTNGGLVFVVKITSFGQISVTKE